MKLKSHFLQVQLWTISCKNTDGCIGHNLLLCIIMDLKVKQELLGIGDKTSVISDNILK